MQPTLLFNTKDKVYCKWTQLMLYNILLLHNIKSIPYFKIMIHYKIHPINNNSLFLKKKNEKMVMLGLDDI